MFRLAAAAATMSSVQALREFVIERLSVAAVEIFAVFERTIVQYEEQLDRQRGLTGPTEMKLHGADYPQQHIQQHVCDMEHLCNHDRSSHSFQQEPAPPQVKEEQEELHSTLERVQLLLQQETDHLRGISTGNEGDHGEPQPGGVVPLFPKPYSCSKCHRSFSRQDTLMVHKRTDTGEKPYPYSQCSSSFIRRCNMKRHQLSHTGEKPYSCSESGKSFIRQCHLMTHEKTHTDVKPYFCSECGKTFTRRSNLVTHKKTHTGEKPYSCSDCGKSFNRSTNLMAHKRTHTGEKPYSCSECPKNFSRRGSLMVHMSTHTGERPYICT